MCICNASSLVRAVTNYGIQHGRQNLLLGQNLLFCAQLYISSAQNIISGSVNRLVDNHTFKLVEDLQLRTASFVRELVLLRGSTCELSNRVNLSYSCRKHMLFDSVKHIFLFIIVYFALLYISVRFDNKYNIGLRKPLVLRV